MQDSGIPVKFQIPWANSAGGAFIRAIPQASQIGIQAGAASLTDGFPPTTFLPVGGGGTPPFGQDFNGILNQITAWLQWLQAGGPMQFDAAFSAAVGGYPKGAVVASVTTFGNFWISTAENNVTNPDAGGAGWTPFSFFGTFTTGDLKPTIKTVADNGWVLMNDGTIGNAGSGATTLASGSAQPLYILMWNNISNVWAPVTGSRGLSGSADFAAGKPMQLLRALGRLFGNAGAGAGLTARALGEQVTELVNTGADTLAELYVNWEIKL